MVSGKTELTIGQHPDGSRWVVGAYFGGNVRIDGYDTIFAGRIKLTVHEARETAAALLAAADWLETGQREVIEAASDA